MKYMLPEWVKTGLAQLPVRRELPKWPTLQVVGKSVTPALGREICLRTTPLHGVFSSVGSWSNSLADAYGVALEEDGWPSFEEVDRAQGDLGILDLDYLGNDRVTASRLNIPSGWCDWDGKIGTAGTDLSSKWPTLEELHQEWGLIAQAWPQLRMTAQLSTYKDSSRPEERFPFLAWDIVNGYVHLRSEPGGLLLPVRPPIEPENVTDDERGVEIETLRLAIHEARERG
ncbi:hypothetical protein [Streptomyces cucumeris]|uniref:hypothetical protein n=1 Tax=Streptomyces cucumeris TaxID=2962890 RepID=UPI0020C845D3|nr:hypothetical protein [Streptomyces sp. NEAU-Y11]MCP9209586.1 hypothetical protein [Streptomyces sp. NEAU-Y11]